MSQLKKSLRLLQTVKRRKYHPLLHQIHKEHRISRKTLLYVKEYGPHTHVARTIIRESLLILIFASLLSAFGGVALEHIREKFIAVIPLIILFPALNDMIGDYGIVLSSRFTTMLHTGKIKGRWYKDKKLQKLFLQVLIVALFTALLSTAISLLISFFSGYALTLSNVLRVMSIGLIDTMIIVNLLFVLAIVAGSWYYKHGEDPDNFLIPIVTSVADFVNMLLLAGLTLWFF